MKNKCNYIFETHNWDGFVFIISTLPVTFSV